MTARFRTQPDLDAALATLADGDPIVARLLAGGLRPVLRRRPAGFAGLASIVVAQQLSTASAAAIWSRVAAALPTFEPDALAAISDDALRTAGLSRPKIVTLRAIAAALGSGTLVLDALDALPGDEAQARLLAPKGVGPWTAQVYRLFCLGDPDAFPAGDIAIRDGLRRAGWCAERPGAGHATALADRWRPWRGAAAHLLWDVYRTARRRDGIAPP